MSDNLPRGDQLARAAARYIGVRFRLNGRDPETGLDCIGLLACSLEAIGEAPAVPEGYALRNSEIQRWIGCAKQSGFVRASGSFQAGDVLVTKPGPGQHHLVIAANNCEVIHAHAGLRRVVRQSFPPIGTIQAHWRLHQPRKGN